MLLVTSLRAIQQASELDKVQKKLGCSRASLGSLSESATVFDPQRLKEIISELSEADHNTVVLSDQIVRFTNGKPSARPAICPPPTQELQESRNPLVGCQC